MSILEFPRARGVKMLMPPVVGYGYFLESPNEISYARGGFSFHRSSEFGVLSTQATVRRS